LKNNELNWKKHSKTSGHKGKIGEKIENGWVFEINRASVFHGVFLRLM